jgi:hypothetical protein
VGIAVVRGRAMAQVVTRRPLTEEARVRARINPYGICGGRSGTGTGISLSFRFSPVNIHSTVALQTRIIWGMRNILAKRAGIRAWLLNPPHLQENKEVVGVDLLGCNLYLYPHTALQPGRTISTYLLL